jgi:hypothetical protein
MSAPKPQNPDLWNVPKAEFVNLKLSVGAHPPNGEACVMEAVSQYLGASWSDHPQAVSREIGAYCRVLNDYGPQKVRDALALRIPRIAKAAKLPTESRWLWAEGARQAAIRALGPEHGAALSRCAPITNETTALAAASSTPSAPAYDATANVAATAPTAVTLASSVAAYVGAVDAADAAACAARAATFAATLVDAAATAPARAHEWTESLALLDRMLDLAEAEGGRA